MATDQRLALWEFTRVNSINNKVYSSRETAAVQEKPSPSLVQCCEYLCRLLLYIYLLYTVRECIHAFMFSLRICTESLIQGDAAKLNSIRDFDASYIPLYIHTRTNRNHATFFLFLLIHLDFFLFIARKKYYYVNVTNV